MSIRFDGQVAIVTGAGRGLGRSHALGLAARGARVVIVDFTPPDGPSLSSSQRVVSEIEEAGGTAVAANVDVTDFASVQSLVDETIRRWGRVDIVVNNAGILRDKTFAKMELSDFRQVMEVHVMGSVHCAKAVWPVMREQAYGRILLTSSSSGLYGNFGQANYGTAKAAMLGLMNVLHLEGERYNIRVNMLLPTAATAMTEGLLTPLVKEQLDPASVTPAVLFLVSKEAPSRVMLCAGAGSFARTLIVETQGVHLPPDSRTPENIAAAFGRISDPAGAITMANAFEQTEKLAAPAIARSQPVGH